MISPQPVFSLKYFRFSKNPIRQGLKRLFYLSWEDALWDILIQKKIKKGSTILLPDFYCVDVENNIKAHGYKIRRYEIFSDLSANTKSFINLLKKYKPSVVVILNPVGMRSNLFKQTNKFTKILENTVLIEDSVHSVIEPSKIIIYQKNHFIIDSLRKVLPLQGSQVFGMAKDLSFKEPPFYQSIGYSINIHWLWFLMELYWILGLYKSAEKLMLRGYELIGDSVKPARGSLIFKFLSQRINISAIEKTKIKQVKYYERLLKCNKIYANSDRPHLRGLPIVLSSGIANKVLRIVRKTGTPIRFELNGCTWSNKQKIIYLPLGFQMSAVKQQDLCLVVKSALKTGK